MRVLKPVLEPALDNNLCIRKKVKNFLTVGFYITEHRVAGAAEGEKAHGRCDADVDTQHAR